jgi:6-pyruvoyltetrahydropterin/6-carboxytetrahydropterin synthase
MRIFIEDSFDSAHWLPNVPEGHKCHNMHGHTYRIRLEFGGDVDPKMGWVIDYSDVKAMWNVVKRRLDHHLLNDIPELSNPTCERIAEFIRNALHSIGLKRIEIRETERCGVVLDCE